MAGNMGGAVGMGRPAAAGTAAGLVAPAAGTVSALPLAPFFTVFTHVRSVLGAIAAIQIASLRRALGHHFDKFAGHVRVARILKLDPLLAADRDVAKRTRRFG
eukprot:scaffold110754_cov69-Phaeocystis_antarctica.AAC.1